jgi:non-specific serine/threonine protein kinase/serine/threonine-protein kinase
MSESPQDSPALTHEELAELEAIFGDAAPLAGSAREAILAARCAGRPRLRAEVLAMLASHDSADDFLRVPELTFGGERDDEGGHDGLGLGSALGPYRLIALIGEGGMGRVYLAERADGLFDHRVAVKVTGTSVRGGDTARRFRAERQILASLRHPNIVTLLDGGATPLGEAYLVMEHVAGVPITAHCRARRLSLEARLQLVCQVAGAVRFAHQHGIVHRDLKPGNILVTEDGVAKVLDFGVAKLLESPLGAEATLTRAFPGPLTPNYASPEQLRGLPVTTASDVYALGVLTYEILTGGRPYETSGKTLDDMLDMVVETEPVRPSATQSARAAEQTVPYSLNRLRGDLDAVVLKAMSKDPVLRYGSAGEFADDVERFLRGHAVVAREPSMGYLLRRLAARNKTAVTIALAALVTIVGALGIALWQKHLAVQAQARAERRSAETRQLANAIIFKIHDAVAPLAGSTPVRETIVKEALAYLERLEADSGSDPSLQLELSRAYRQIGYVQGNPGSANLGNRAEALKQYEKARRLGKPLALAAGASSEAISNLVNINLVMVPLVKETGSTEAAATLGQEAIEQALIVDRLAGGTPDSRRLLGRALFGMALVYHPEEPSIVHWQRALDHYERDLRNASDNLDFQRNVALVCKYLGSVHETAEREERALPFFRRALELDERRAAAQPGARQTQFDVAVSLSTLATSLERLGNDAEAAALYKRSLDIRRVLSDSDPKDVLNRAKMGYVQMRLARMALAAGRAEEARGLAAASLDVQESVLRQTNDKSSRRDVAAALLVLGRAERTLERRALACRYFARAEEAFAAAPSSSYLADLESDARIDNQRCRVADTAADR